MDLTCFLLEPFETFNMFFFFFFALYVKIVGAKKRDNLKGAKGEEGF